jgi:hypothetical protein
MIEVLKQALEALEPFGTPRWAGSGVDKANQAIASLQQAIKDLESQEPVAWIAPRYEGGHENLEVVDEREFGAFRVYTAPPQRTWQGLTDKDIKTICSENGWDSSWQSLRFAQAIEAKLKERNL